MRMDYKPTKRLGYFPTFFFFLVCMIFNQGNLLTVSSQSQQGQQITTISISSDGSLGNGASFDPSISSDGRFIAYISQAKNLVTEPSSFTKDLYLHDRLLGITTRLAIDCHEMSMSSNGRIFTITPTEKSAPPYLLDILTKNTTSILQDMMYEKSITNIKIEGLSSDGRYGVLSAPKDIQIKPPIDFYADDLFIYDRYHDQLVSLPTDRLRIDRNSGFPISAISGDGRTIIFQASNVNQIGQFKNPAIYLYNRVLGDLDTLTFSLIDNGKWDGFSAIDISESGDILAVQYKQDNSGSGKVIVVGLQGNSKREILNLNSDSRGISLSADGKFLAVFLPSSSGGSKISRFDLTNGETILIDEGILGHDLDLSGDGSKIVYTKEVNDAQQVFLWDEDRVEKPTYTLSGRITDSTGSPLALVSIQDNQRHKTSTDHEGYFWIDGVLPGIVKLVPKKTGFEFHPESLSIDVDADKPNLDYTYTHKESLEEAEKDLGMPYNRNRGNNGSFHGFKAGYCTDLILDAFSWGVDFDIQFALEMDYKAHPWHFYRWRDARDAQDMWRYFSYSRQIHPHEDPYLPGDIVFFDWTQDGEIDHVALVSEIDKRNRPDRMFDATGIIDSNPGGLAAELEWESFHERTVRGFARWSGLYEPIIADFPLVEVLQFAVSADRVNFHLIDETGATISSSEDETTVGRYTETMYERSISLTDIFSTSRYFLLVFTNPSDQQTPFKFTGQYLINGLVVDRIEFSGVLSSYDRKALPILLETDGKGDAVIKTPLFDRRIEGELH